MLCPLLLAILLLLLLPALAESTAASQAAEIKRLEDFVARFGAKASKASEAQSKLKVCWFGLRLFVSKPASEPNTP
jgi:hypothetical protein